MASGLSGRKASAQRRHASDVRSPRRPGTARISGDFEICPSRADQYGSRSPLVAGNVATPTAGSPSSPSDCLGWWTLVRDRHGVRPASCACCGTASEACRAKIWPRGWALQPNEAPSCGISYGTSVCPTIRFLGLTALWLRAAKAGTGALGRWQDCIVLAHELLAGRGLAELPAMVTLAERSLSAARWGTF